jgi:hypothetical protein
MSEAKLSSLMMTNESAEHGIIDEAFETIDLLPRWLSVLNKCMFVYGVIPSLRLRKLIGVSTSLCPTNDKRGFSEGYASLLFTSTVEELY